MAGYARIFESKIKAGSWQKMRVPSRGEGKYEARDTALDIRGRAKRLRA